MKRIPFFIVLISLIVIMISCSSLSSKQLLKEQQWSENYALSDGVQSTSPEMIDGDIGTSGKMLFPESVYGGKAIVGAFPNAEVTITLPEKKSISKIVIYSDDLEDFNIYASIGMRGGKEDWKLLKEFIKNKDKEIIIRTSVLTDKILIKAKGKMPLESTESVRVLGGIVRQRKVMEPEIKEIELYGFK
ncbi:MAG: hypothetical protein ACPL7B_07310 [Candidatus Poribacteria bacterium]